MLLVADVGNTNTKVGVYDGARLLASWRIISRREQTADEYGLLLKTLLATRDIPATAIEAVAIANVVPPVQQTLEWMCEQYFGVTPFNVESARQTAIVVNVDYPEEVGADRIVTAVAASAIYRPPVIVVDLGTATKFNCVNAAGEFIGGAIAPGIRTSADALLSRAARLFNVELVRPKETIGRNTATNIQSGFVYGFVALVDGMVERIRAEMGESPTVVATGGLAPLIQGAARTIEHVNAELALEGLRLAYAGGGPRRAGAPR